MAQCQINVNYLYSQYNITFMSYFKTKGSLKESIAGGYWLRF